LLVLDYMVSMAPDQAESRHIFLALGITGVVALALYLVAVDPSHHRFMVGYSSSNSFPVAIYP
jgi:hypothetical protein